MNRAAARLAAIGSLLPAELLFLTLRFDGALLASEQDWRAEALVAAHYLPQLLIVVAGAAIALDPARFRRLGTRLTSACDARPRRWLFLFAHLACFAALYLLSRSVFQQARSNPLLAFGWTAAAAGTLALWLASLAPWRFWLQEIRNGARPLAAAVGVGAAAWLAGQFASRYWEAFAGAAFTLSQALLGLLYEHVEASPETRVLGVDGFAVEIARECSGLEGIGLVVVLLAAYLWFFRDRHRLLPSLLLLPLGAATIWIFNAVRIAALVVVGAEVSPAIAVQGFHSQAGWISFTLVSLAIVAAASRIPFFLKEAPPPAAPPRPADSAAYLAPLLALLAVMMLTGLLAIDVDWLYPLRIAAAGAALLYYRRSYRRFLAAPSFEAVAVGAAVFVLWMAFESFRPAGDSTLEDGLSQMSAGGRFAWLSARVLGSVIVIPLLEELAFRGYLIRRLTSADFEAVPFHPLALVPVLASSIAFGLMHDRWLAGTFAGLAYAWMLQRRGRLSDPIAAHMTTNALIAVAVLAAGWWNLWT